MIGGSCTTKSNARRTWLAFGLGLATILTALGFQHLGGFQPCELCLAERQPYYWGLPLILIVAAGIKILPAPPRIFLTVIAAGLFVWGTWMAAYHAGVEWHFWPGPDSCTGAATAIDFSQLDNINATRVVPCDEAPIRILGISMAGYNALISAFIAFLLFWSAFGQFRRCRLDLKKMQAKAEAGKTATS